VKTPIAFGVALALLVLWPGWTWPLTAMIGDEGLETWAHAWGLAWFADSLMSGSLPWAVDGLAHPRGGVLWYIDPLGALLTLPVNVLLGPVAAFNLVAVVEVVLAGAAGMLYGRALGGPGWVAGAACATTPWLLGELHNAIQEACWIGLIPLAGWAAVSGKRWAGAVVGLAALATPYHGVSAALIVTAHLAFRPRELIRAGVLAAVVALPPFLVMQASMGGELALASKAPVAINLGVLRINATDWVALFTPGDFWTVDFDAPLNPPFRRTPYLGAVVALGALAGVYRRPRHAWLLVPVVVGVSFCLGPYLWHDGDFVRTADGALLALPFRWFQQALSVPMEHPLRFVAMAVVALAGLADVGARGSLAPLIALLVVLEHLLVAPNPWPLNTSPAEVPEVYDHLEDDGLAVIDLPADRGTSFGTSRYLFWQARHGHPLPYASKVSSEGYPSMNHALRTWTALGRLHPLPPEAPGTPPANADLPAAVDELREEGFGYVVVHPDLMAADHMTNTHVSALTGLLGPPEVVAGRYLWRLSSGTSERR